MSPNNWMAIMDKMAAVIHREAIATLCDAKKCFDQEGRCFDEEFKKYFFHVSINSLAVAYCHIEFELQLNALHTENSATNQMNFNNNSIGMAAESSNHLVALKTESDEASTNNMILILDSSNDEESSHAQSIMDTSQNVIAGKEVAVANGSTMKSGYGSIAMMNLNHNSKLNDQTEIENEVIEPKKETNVFDATPSVLVPFSHQLRMVPIETLMCPCSNGETKATATSHKKAASALGQMKKVFKCQFCEFTGNFRWNIERHERTHTGEKPHRCKRCTKSFAQLSQLQMHAKIHAKEFAFHCPGCFKGFAQKTKHDIHIKMCKAPRYECHICKKNSFIRKGNLERHMRTHNGERPFHCEICLKRFTQRSHLKSHLNIVH